MTEQDHIADAQRRLEAHREALGLDRHALAMSTQTAPVLSLARSYASKAHRSRPGECALCAAPVGHPGICAACGEREDRAERTEAIKAAIKREIPVKYRWASWSSPLLASRVRGGEHKIASARRALDRAAEIGVNVVLVGAASVGKTTLGAAWLREQIESGQLCGRFVAAVDLASEEASEDGGPIPYKRALTGSPLVLDDVGAELQCAPIGGGILAQRVEWTAKLVARRHDLDRRLVVTTAIGAELGHEASVTDLGRALAKVYGDGFARRIYEHAAVVRLGGA